MATYFIGSHTAGRADRRAAGGSEGQGKTAPETQHSVCETQVTLIMSALIGVQY